jgi:2-polyprenyl-3-methyl-5-hydroxy-6-metoxy-1,4-benzoquinol methylase
MVIRDYNKEMENTNNRKYSYSFDKVVMNPYIVKTIIPFVDTEEILEIGASKGDLTKILLKYFDRVTAIEPSSEGIESILKINDKNLNVYNTTLENFKPKKKFDSIIMSHVLEHITDRVEALKTISSQILNNSGRLIVVVPNGNALSRQIANAMGLINGVSSITKDESKQGHKITFTLDTLKSELYEAGYSIVFSTGIMMKQFANFQWDQAIERGIVDRKFFEGSYEIGLKYPDLCSSILCVCQKKPTPLYYDSL